MSSRSSRHHIFVKVMKNFSCKPIAHGGQQKHLIYKDNLYWKIMVLLGQEYWDSERTGTSTSNQHLNSYIINKLATWLYPIFQTYLRRIVGHSWTTVLTGNMLTESMITCKTMKKKMKNQHWIWLFDQNQFKNTETYANMFWHTSRSTTNSSTKSKHDQFFMLKLSPN